MNQFLTTLFFVLLTLKLTSAAVLSWWIVCAPLFVILGFVALSVTLTFMLSFAKKVKKRGSTK